MKGRCRTGKGNTGRWGKGVTQWLHDVSGSRGGDNGFQIYGEVREEAGGFRVGGFGVGLF